MVNAILLFVAASVALCVPTSLSVGGRLDHGLSTVKAGALNRMAQLPSDPYGPNPHGPNPHGPDPHDEQHADPNAPGDPHDENHDSKLPANKDEIDRKNHQQ